MSHSSFYFLRLTEHLGPPKILSSLWGVLDNPQQRTSFWGANLCMRLSHPQVLKWAAPGHAHQPWRSSIHSRAQQPPSARQGSSVSTLPTRAVSPHTSRDLIQDSWCLWPLKVWREDYRNVDRATDHFRPCLWALTLATPGVRGGGRKWLSLQQNPASDQILLQLSVRDKNSHRKLWKLDEMSPPALWDLSVSSSQGRHRAVVSPSCQNPATWFCQWLGAGRSKAFALRNRGCWEVPRVFLANARISTTDFTSENSLLSS